MPSSHTLNAWEAAEAIAAGALTSEALVRDCLARIDARDPAIAAWTHLDPEQALAQARDRDRASARGPLHGVPVGIKDIIDTADMPTTYGSPIYAGHQTAWDAACVALLRQAGAVILGKTVSTEFAMYEPGKTANPPQPGAHAGRLVQWLGGGGGGGDGAAGAGQPDGRLHRAPGVVLRRGGLQADARRFLAGRDQTAVADAGHARRFRPLRAGPGAAAGGADGQSATTGGAGGAAAYRPVPHAAMAAGNARHAGGGGSGRPALCRRRGAGRRGDAASRVRRPSGGADDGADIRGRALLRLRIDAAPRPTERQHAAPAGTGRKN